MKQLFIYLSLIILFTACSVDDDHQESTIENSTEEINFSSLKLVSKKGVTKEKGKGIGKGKEFEKYIEAVITVRFKSDVSDKAREQLRTGNYGFEILSVEETDCDDVEHWTVRYSEGDNIDIIIIRGAHDGKAAGDHETKAIGVLKPSTAVLKLMNYVERIEVDYVTTEFDCTLF
ncbi:hypothetical protein ABW636_18300 [Aquimarina sp. 2201CG1-2-11]|uniref:hypothetical protein n=1 Tax=Aquimarina discodermiae TaxID=3231043 RepID=UPI0034623F43